MEGLSMAANPPAEDAAEVASPAAPAAAGAASPAAPAAAARRPARAVATRPRVFCRPATRVPGTRKDFPGEGPGKPFSRVIGAGYRGALPCGLAAARRGLHLAGLRGGQAPRGGLFLLAMHFIPD